MNIAKILVLGLTLSLATSVKGQVESTLQQQIQQLGELESPTESRTMMYDIIRTNKLDDQKDSETIDIMKGTVAMDYLKTGDYPAFENMLASIRNPFNRTSFLNMGSAQLLREGKDARMAEKLAKKTLDLYLSFKDDPKARPAAFAEEDWNRFMKFAYYPYCDTYAHALYAVGKYKKALDYQIKAFDTTAEDGMPASVARYADLLVKNGQREKAYKLLVHMAEIGKSTVEMNSLLKELYLQNQGNETDFDQFFGGLQKNVVATLKQKYKKEMLHNDAPDFKLKDLEGKTVSLSDYRGKIVVIDFWATWCAPCKAAFPAMVKVQKRHPEVAFLFIATQEKQDGAQERVHNFISDNDYPFYVLMDEPIADSSRKFVAASVFQVTGIPAKVVIDANGKQRFFSTGFTTDMDLINELEAKIQLTAE